MTTYIILFQHKIGNRVARSTMSIEAKTQEEALYWFRKQSSDLSEVSVTRVNDSWWNKTV